MERERTFRWKDIWRRLKRDKLALTGLLIIAAFALTAIFGPLIVPYDPLKVDFGHRLESPSIKHPFGTDDLGRDLFSRIIFGSRVSLQVGVIAIGIGAIIGLVMGAISGYFGGIGDAIIMRSADIFFAIPYILFAIAIMTILGPGLINVFIAIGILEWAHFARLFRGSILSIRENDYIEAARAIGAGDLRIISHHIFPNAITPVIVYGAMSVGGAIITEAALSFLGIGVQPPQPSWGKMLAESRPFMATAPWMMYFPGLAILVTVLSFVLLADGLRDALDPRLR